MIIACKQILRDAHKLCKKLNQSVQRNLNEKTFNKLIQTVEESFTNYPLCDMAQDAVTMVKKIIPYCDDELLHSMMIKHEVLQMMTTDYHYVTTLILPHIKLYITLHEKIIISLLNRSRNIEQTYHYINSGKFENLIQLININRFIKLQQVAPNTAHKLSSQH